VGQLFVFVPYVPTPQATVDAMVRAANLRSGQTVYDLGAGDARFLIAAAKACPGICAIGYELAPIIWLLGRIRIFVSRADVTLHFGNALRADVRDADAVFLYLLPRVLGRLEPLLDAQLKPGTHVFSYAFRFPGKEHRTEIVLEPGKPGKRIWTYVWPA